MKEYLDVLFPVGRLVSGSCYTPQTKDAKGNPLLFKSGAQAGQPRVAFNIGVAIKKEPGHTHWSQTAWGQQIYAFAAAGMPALYQRRDFAFKIGDGDSQEVNQNNKRNCDREGYPGHWVVFFSNGTIPGILNANGTQAITEPNAIKKGFYVQVFATIKCNGDTGNPGIYISHKYVALSGYGEEISTLPDPQSLGFGGALPPGASTVPVGIAPVAHVPPAVPAAPAPVAHVPPAVPGAVPPPHYAVLGTTPPPPPAAPAAPVGPQPTAKAAGATLDQMLAWPGWTMDLLAQQGYIA